MTMSSAIELARMEKYHPVPPFVVAVDKGRYPAPSIEEAIEIMEDKVRSCWFS